MSESRTIKVSKLDAARRQLDGAIDLWFSNGDPVAIHTLVCAAHQIIQDVNEKKGDRSLGLVETMRTQVKPEHLEEAMNMIKRPMMFFKHANRDPGGILEFNPALSEGFMFFAIEGLKSLGEQISDYQTVLLFWFGLHKPHLFVKGRLLEKLIPVEELRRVEKREFLETSLLALAKIRAKSR